MISVLLGHSSHPGTGISSSVRELAELQGPNTRALLILGLKQCCSHLILKYVGMDLQHLGEICPGSVGRIKTSVQSSEICGNHRRERFPCELEFRSFHQKANFQQREDSLLITQCILQELQH